MGGRQGGMVECGRRVSELVWREGLRVLGLQREGIGVLEVMVRSQGMWVEAVEMGGRCILAGVDPSFRGGKREWCS